MFTEFKQKYVYKAPSSDRRDEPMIKISTLYVRKSDVYSISCPAINNIVKSGQSILTLTNGSEYTIKLEPSKLFELIFGENNDKST